MLPLCYIASPISDPDPIVVSERLRRASEFAAQLLDTGVPVFCPAAHGRSLVEFANVQASAEYWMAVDLPLLRACRVLVVLTLPGWAKSVGVALEIREAEAAGIPVLFGAADDEAGMESLMAKLAEDASFPEEP